MLRFSLGLITITLISCSSHHDQPGGQADPPDAAPTGPFTVTIGMHGLGVALSNPPGISCGKCSDAGSGVPCPLPDPNQAATDCSHAFDAGTKVSLGLGGQQDFLGVSCTYSPNSIVPIDAGPYDSCSFVVTQNTTVDVIGLEAVR
jgi:hypothetical protein